MVPCFNSNLTLTTICPHHNLNSYLRFCCSACRSPQCGICVSGSVRLFSSTLSFRKQYHIVLAIPRLITCYCIGAKPAVLHTTIPAIHHWNFIRFRELLKCKISESNSFVLHYGSRINRTGTYFRWPDRLMIYPVEIDISTPPICNVYQTWIEVWQPDQRELWWHAHTYSVFVHMHGLLRDVKQFLKTAAFKMFATLSRWSESLPPVVNLPFCPPDWSPVMQEGACHEANIIIH